MQRIACLLIGITAACGDSTASGPATLTGTTPPGKSVGARTFAGLDAEGVEVLGWKLEFFEQGPGADCLSAETNVVASIGIWTKQPAGTQPQALLDVGVGIPITTMSPPMVNGSAAATMAAEGVVIQSGLLTISEFHRTPDNMHADRIKGTVTAGGNDGAGNPLQVDGTFEAPYCPEED
ncbi:MAG TPA: hypothetical protein VIV11_06465 [Kofleriaceae bacterium]